MKKMEKCLFCNIAKGVFPSATLFEDENFRVILDKFPGTKGHILVMPKEHIENIYDLDLEIAAQIFPLVARVAKVMKKVLNCQGMNILQNNGKIAGQTVFHFHIHLIPRYESDGVEIHWTPKEAEDEALASLAKTLLESQEFA